MGLKLRHSGTGKTHEVPDTRGGRIAGDTMIRTSNGKWSWVDEKESTPAPKTADKPKEKS